MTLCHAQVQFMSRSCHIHVWLMYGSCIVHVRSAQGHGEVRIILSFILIEN